MAKIKYFVSLIALYYFHMKTKYIIKKKIYHKQNKKTYTVTSSPNCQLLSTLFCPHLLHPTVIRKSAFKRLALKEENISQYSYKLYIKLKRWTDLVCKETAAYH